MSHFKFSFFSSIPVFPPRSCRGQPDTGICQIKRSYYHNTNIFGSSFMIIGIFTLDDKLFLLLLFLHSSCFVSIYFSPILSGILCVH